MNRFFKTAAILILVVVMSACSPAERREKFIQELMPKNGKYSVHLFYGERGNPEHDLHDLNEFVNSDPRILNLLQEVEGQEISADIEKKLKKGLGFSEVPLYILVDNNGLQLLTPYLSELKDFIRKEAEVQE